MQRLFTGVLPLLLLSSVSVGAATAQSQPTAETRTASTLATANPNDETLYLSPDTTFPFNLAVTSATMINGVSLPAGAVVRGQFEPVPGGLRYVANGFEVSNRIFPLQAASETLHDIKDPRETSAGAILGDAAIGAAGGAVLGGILGGGVSASEVLGGAAVGTIIGNVSAQRVVIVEPGQAIVLTMQ